jgi:hypothetical protein
VVHTFTIRLLRAKLYSLNLLAKKKKKKRAAPFLCQPSARIASLNFLLERGHYSSNKDIQSEPITKETATVMKAQNWKLS